MISCGWCGNPTANLDRCSSCGHADPPRPWVQRGATPPAIRTDAAGRPTLDVAEIRRRLTRARDELGAGATVDRTAELLEVSPRTVRRWREMAG